MPATSPEAIERKKQRRIEKRKAAKAALAPVRVDLKKSAWPRYKIAARKMLGRAPDMTKEQLRQMLAQAAANTPRSCDA